VRMRRRGWNRGPGFRVLSIEQARNETGLTFEELLGLPDVELMTRVFADGRKDEALRLPVQPVSDEKDVR
jgi:hypothetical protein